MRALIATLSCHVYRGYEQAIRETWAKEIPEGIDHKFFLGCPKLSNAFPDEESLSVDDSFHGITKKTVGIFLWSLERGYDYVFKSDLDTLIRPALLATCGFEQHDYMGGRNHYFASGGSGYWLSKKAMQFVVNYPISTGPEEDVHTARALTEKGIELCGDDRFKFCPGDHMDDRTITFHLSSTKAWDAKATPEDMYKVWEDQKNREYKSYSVGKPEVRSLRPRRFQ